jgi:hypothetical protein
MRGYIKGNFDETGQLTPLNRVLLEKLIVRSRRQEISRLLWNPKFHYWVHVDSPLVPIKSLMNPIYTSTA